MTDTGRLGRITTSEIASQPKCWARAHAHADQVPAGFPAPGERVLALGCGTSYYVAAAYGWLREQSGEGLTDALIASEVPDLVRPYDRVLAISRSGTTTEVLGAIGRLDPTIPVTAVVGEIDTPLCERADHVINLSYADEESVVQTRFPTTLLVLMRALLGEREPARRKLLERAQQAIAAPVDPTPPGQLVVLGTGWTVPLAQEAALKCREAAGMWAESYACGEYLHGPISVAGPQTLVWPMAALTASQVRAIGDTGARIREIGVEPLAELIQLQRHAVAWAAVSGRDADLPAHLTRSVVLR